MRLHRFTPAQIAYVRELYTEFPVKEIKPLFNSYFRLSLSEQQLRTMIKNHGIKSGRSGRFEKGQRSWNEGVKGYMGANSTSFKKGNRPKNWTPVGTERYETKDRYIKVKVAEPNVWKFKHRLEWERRHGPIPAGKVVVFKDGDRENCDISNLELIDRGVLAQYNKMRGHSAQPELRTAMRTIAAIKVTSSRRLKDAEVHYG